MRFEAGLHCGMHGMAGGGGFSIPAFNACLNAASATLLLIAWTAGKRFGSGRYYLLLGVALVSSICALASGLYYRTLVGPFYFGGIGPVRLLYFPLVASRRILAAAIAPMIARCIYLSWTGRFAEYARLSRWTFPLWLYVSTASLAIFWLRGPDPSSTKAFDFEDRVRAAAELPGAPSWAGVYADDPGIEGPDRIVTLSTAGYSRGNGYMSSGGDWGTVVPEGDGVVHLLQAGWKPVGALRLIAWDGRTYAIREDQMMKFINEVNAALGPAERDFVSFEPYKAPEGRHGGIFRHTLGPSGLPRVPENWRSLILERPIEATITKVGAVRYVRDIYPRRIAVEVDAGRRSGLFPGMKLHLRNFDGPTWIVIAQVNENSSSGEAWQSDAVNPFESIRLPWVGQKATSYETLGDIWEKR